jgi:hypothetical protein
MSNLLKAALTATALLAVAGCAQPSMFVARPPDLENLDLSRGPAPSFRNAISVGAVTVGEDLANPWRSTVAPADIQQQLALTLQRAGLGAPPGGGRYRLDAVLMTLQRPYAGFAMTVSAQIGYRMTDVATGAVVYSSTLTTLGTASLDDAVFNETRLRIANERAVRNNLRALISELFALPEPPPPARRR